MQSADGPSPDCTMRYVIYVVDKQPWPSTALHLPGLAPRGGNNGLEVEGNHDGVTDYKCQGADEVQPRGKYCRMAAIRPKHQAISGFAVSSGKGAASVLRLGRGRHFSCTPHNSFGVFGGARGVGGVNSRPPVTRSRVELVDVKCGEFLVAKRGKPDKPDKPLPPPARRPMKGPL